MCRASRKLIRMIKTTVCHELFHSAVSNLAITRVPVSMRDAIATVRKDAANWLVGVV